MKRIFVSGGNYGVTTSDNLTIKFGLAETKEYDGTDLTDEQIEEIKKDPKLASKHIKKLKEIKAKPKPNLIDKLGKKA